VAGTSLNDDAALANGGLPNRLLTAFEVAEFVGCHEETVRRAYLRGLLVSQRFGVRSRRFHPRDVLDWIASVHRVLERLGHVPNRHPRRDGEGQRDSQSSAAHARP